MQVIKMTLCKKNPSSHTSLILILQNYEQINSQITMLYDRNERCHAVLKCLLVTQS